MSYSSFLKSSPDKLGQTTGIAVMASVVVHALLAITLPYWPVFSREQPKQLREVELVGLTPEMASRLPPPPKPPEPLLLPPSQPPSTFSQKPTQDYDLGKLLTTPRQSVGRRNKTQSSKESSQDDKKRVVIGPIFADKTIKIPELEGGKGVQARNFTAEELARLTAKPNIKIEGLDNNIPSFSGEPNNNIPSFSGETNNNIPSFSGETNNNIPSFSEEPNNNIPSFSEEPNNNTPPPEEQNNQTAYVPPSPESPEQKIERMRASITPNQENTSPEAAEENRKKLQEEWNQEQATNSTISGNYPTLACYKKLEGTSVVGVLVGADGKASQQQLIQSAGYPLFDEQAQKDIQSRSFPNQTGKPKLFHVNVNFKYDGDICPSLTVPQESNQEESSSEKPTSQNSNQEESTSEKPTSQDSNQEDSTSEKPTSQDSNQEDSTSEKPNSQQSNQEDSNPEDSTEG